MSKTVRSCFNCIYCDPEIKQEEILKKKGPYFVQGYILGVNTFICDATGQKIDMANLRKLNCKKSYRYNRGQSFKEYFSEEARKREFRHNMKYKILWGSIGVATGAIISFLIKAL